MEYFCGQTCASSHGLDKHCNNTHDSDSNLKITTFDYIKSTAKWLPNQKNIVFSHSFLLILENVTNFFIL